MTGGPLRPVILLPASAKNWTSGRREMVVSHELVHVRRRDALWRLVAGAVGGDMSEVTTFLFLHAPARLASW